ncbi:MAG: Uma2 family endonuclease [Candidatus Cloacimonetes bacterium]|nr:Uma2 family endonuclease [Candidatus Cloacimonadota bacterium]
MTQPIAEKNGFYTYKDYKTWDDDVRYELIDGVAYALAAPNQNHQRVLKSLTRQLDTYFEKKSCELFISPSDVRLNHDTDDKTVVQPDLYVVCDKSKLDGQNCNGAPDLVIEIVSPSTSNRDHYEKLHKYLEAGVLEYWTVDPDTQRIIIFIQDKGTLSFKTYGKNEKLLSYIFQDLIVDLSLVFKDVMPSSNLPTKESKE